MSLALSFRSISAGCRRPLPVRCDRSLRQLSLTLDVAMEACAATAIRGVRPSWSPLPLGGLTALDRSPRALQRLTARASVVLGFAHVLASDRSPQAGCC